MPKWSRLPLVKRKGDPAARPANTAGPRQPVIPSDILHDILDIVPRDALAPLMAVNKACNLRVEPLIYRHLDMGGYRELLVALKDKMYSEILTNKQVPDTRYDRVIQMVRTLTKNPHDTVPLPLRPGDILPIPWLQTIRLSGKAGDEQSVFTLTSLSEPSTAIFDYNVCDPPHKVHNHGIVNYPKSIVRQLQLVHDMDTALVQDSDSWEYASERSTFIVFLPQDTAKWTASGGVETGLKTLIDGWLGWFHPVTFVGAEYLGLAGTTTPQTVMQALQKGLDDYIGDWWDGEETSEHAWRKWLTEQEETEEMALKRDRGLMRWKTLAEFMQSEICEDEIKLQEAEGWVRKWAEYGAVPCEPLSPPQTTELPQGRPAPGEVSAGDHLVTEDLVLE